MKADFEGTFSPACRRTSAGRPCLDDEGVALRAGGRGDALCDGRGAFRPVWTAGAEPGVKNLGSSAAGDGGEDEANGRRSCG